MKPRALLRVAITISLLVVGFSIAPIRTPTANASECPCNLFGSAAPTTADSGPDPYPISLGLVFSPKVNGYITGLRFYKSAANTGTHKGFLYEWNSHGEMASVVFGGETASGWQSAAFAQPQWVLQGVTYEIAYEADNGHYAVDVGGFSSLHPSNAFLQVVDPGSRYTYTLNSAPSTDSGNNYWVDPTFAQYQPVDSLFDMTQQPPQVPQTAYHASGVVGTRFSSDVNTKVTGIRYWFNSWWFQPPTLYLYDSDGSLLKTASYTDYDIHTGWFEVFFDSPVAITAGHEYVVASDDGIDRNGYTANYFTTPYSSGAYHAPANAGVWISGSGTMPTNQTSTNYWIDPMFSLDSNAAFSATVDPTFSFGIAGATSTCNGEANFSSTAGSPTSVTLGHLAAGTKTSGGQALSIISNAGGGFSVYVRGVQTANNLRNASHNWTDVTGNYSSPAALGSGERFGYTYADSTAPSSLIGPMPAGFVALDATDRAIMSSSTARTGSGCISYTAQSDSFTPSGTFAATVVYTALPTF